MRRWIYVLLRLWIRSALWIYFSKISIKGLANIPKQGPVLFLANHQNALLDALLIATHGPRKIYFLTRSDVFKNPLLKLFFNYLQMIPIYRIRDGKESLELNASVFDRCSQLLQNGEAILIFPEGNHSLKRRVRPLSKGFTRFLFAALDDSPYLDIRLVPIGMNYVNAARFPDKVSLFYGKDIRVLAFYDKEAKVESVKRLKTAVYRELTGLTTHIEIDRNHDVVVAQLIKQGANFLDPAATNVLLKEPFNGAVPLSSQGGTSLVQGSVRSILGIINFPVLLIWSKGIRPKIKELEFLSSVRFMVFLLFFPTYYLLSILILLCFTSMGWAFFIVAAHILFNLLLVRLLAQPGSQT